MSSAHANSTTKRLVLEAVYMASLVAIPIIVFLMVLLISPYDPATVAALGLVFMGLVGFVQLWLGKKIAATLFLASVVIALPPIIASGTFGLQWALFAGGAEILLVFAVLLYVYGSSAHIFLLCDGRAGKKVTFRYNSRTRRVHAPWVPHPGHLSMVVSSPKLEGEHLVRLTLVADRWSCLVGMGQFEDKKHGADALKLVIQAADELNRILSIPYEIDDRITQDREKPETKA